jgi:hypothetical protein
MKENIWKLRLRDSRNGPNAIGETPYNTERGFVFALQTAWRNFASDISATLPTGEVLDDVTLRRRYLLSDCGDWISYESRSS